MQLYERLCIIIVSLMKHRHNLIKRFLLQCSDLRYPVIKQRQWPRIWMDVSVNSEGEHVIPVSLSTNSKGWSCGSRGIRDQHPPDTIYKDAHFLRSGLEVIRPSVLFVWLFVCCCFFFFCWAWYEAAGLKGSDHTGISTGCRAKPHAVLKDAGQGSCRAH